MEITTLISVFSAGVLLGISVTGYVIINAIKNEEGVSWMDVLYRL